MVTRCLPRRPLSADSKSSADLEPALLASRDIVVEFDPVPVNLVADLVVDLVADSRREDFSVVVAVAACASKGMRMTISSIVLITSGEPAAASLLLEGA